MASTILSKVMGWAGAAMGLIVAVGSAVEVLGVSVTTGSDGALVFPGFSVWMLITVLSSPPLFPSPPVKEEIIAKIAEMLDQLNNLGCRHGNTAQQNYCRYNNRRDL